MKNIKYIIAFSVFFAMMPNAHAETIEAGMVGLSPSIPSAGSVATVCQNVAFITKNTGTLLTGLTTANLKPISAKQKSLNTATYTYNTSSVSIKYGLWSTTRAGIYNLCVTPSNFSWNNSSGTIYSFDFVVNGTVAADNGLLSMMLSL